MRVIHGSALRPRSALQAAYDEFRLDRQGELVSPRTLEYYDDRIGQFLRVSIVSGCCGGGPGRSWRGKPTWIRAP